MEVSKHVHAIKIPFQLRVAEGKMVDRSVYAYVILGRKVDLLDAGVRASVDLIFDYVKKLDRDPSEIAMLVLTHSHADHIGGGVFEEHSSSLHGVVKDDRVPVQHSVRAEKEYASASIGLVRVDEAVRYRRSRFPQVYGAAFLRLADIDYAGREVRAGAVAVDRAAPAVDPAARR